MQIGRLYAGQSPPQSDLGTRRDRQGGWLDIR
jgi:hypothetical protein